MLRAVLTFALLLVAAILTLPRFADAQTTRGGAGVANEAVAERPDLALIWPEITWVQGADFAEFDRTIRQSRDGVRRQLTAEFIEMMRSLMEYGALAELIIEPVFKVLLTFDQMHEVHKAEASARLGVSLEAVFMAEFDDLHRRYNIESDERRAMFATNGDFALIRHHIASGRELTREQKDWIVSRLRYVSFGTWTISGQGEVVLTYTLENLVTGEHTNFDARGAIEEATRFLAFKVFEFFQENQYGSWKNPLTHLEWVAPSRTQPIASAAVARLYCQSQGARLPYARELLVAMQGSQFKPGGIPSFSEGESWIIADRRRYDEQYYYFVGQEASTGGAIRTDAGQGFVQGKYWCVRGKASPDVMIFEDLFRHVRVFEAKKDEAGVVAVRAVLKSLGEPDQDWLMPMRLPSLHEALEALAARGVRVDIPASLR